MKATKDDLANVAVLSRLSIADDEAEGYMKDLNAFLNYVGILNSLDTENVEPTTYALPMENVFRADEIKPSLSRDAALMNAPASENGYFCVPRVLEE